MPSPKSGRGSDYSSAARPAANISGTNGNKKQNRPQNIEIAVNITSEEDCKLMPISDSIEDAH